MDVWSCGGRVLCSEAVNARILRAFSFERDIASAFGDGPRIRSSAADVTRADARGVIDAADPGRGMGPIKESTWGSCSSSVSIFLSKSSSFTAVVRAGWRAEGTGISSWLSDASVSESAGEPAQCDHACHGAQNRPFLPPAPWQGLAGLNWQGGRRCHRPPPHVAQPAPRACAACFICCSFQLDLLKAPEKESPSYRGMPHRALQSQ
jgi:hypothetical protein